MRNIIEETPAIREWVERNYPFMMNADMVKRSEGRFTHNQLIWYARKYHLRKCDRFQQHKIENAVRLSNATTRHKYTIEDNDYIREHFVKGDIPWNDMAKHLGVTWKTLVRQARRLGQYPTEQTYDSLFSIRSARGAKTKQLKMTFKK